MMFALVPVSLLAFAMTRLIASRSLKCCRSVVGGGTGADASEGAASEEGGGSTLSGAAAHAADFGVGAMRLDRGRAIPTGAATIVALRWPAMVVRPRGLVALVRPWPPKWPPLILNASLPLISPVNTCSKRERLSGRRGGIAAAFSSREKSKDAFDDVLSLATVVMNVLCAGGGAGGALSARSGDGRPKALAGL